MHRGTAPSGFTLIELTIVLAVIVTLALVLTPSIANIIQDSRVARANSDCKQIANAVVQFYKDTGFFPQWARTLDGGPGEAADRLTLVVGPGNTPQGRLTDPALQGWLVQPAERGVGSLADQLMSNGIGYLMRSPSVPLGWNGPYLSSPIGADPWNNRYMANVGLLDTSQGVQTASGAVKSAVWVISAGPDGVLQTPFNLPVTRVQTQLGDDIGFRIQ
jgi:general secretion pathway protein G